MFLTKVDEQANVACPDNSGITSVMLAPPVPHGILLTVLVWPVEHIHAQRTCLNICVKAVGIRMHVVQCGDEAVHRAC